MANIENGILAGEQRIINADNSETFLHWSGDTQYLSDSGSSTTTVTMPNRNVVFTAIYQSVYDNFEMTISTNGQEENSEISLYLVYSNSGDSIEVDWGDGIIDTIDCEYKKHKDGWGYYTEHIYETPGDYNVSFTPPSLTDCIFVDVSSDCITDLTLPTYEELDYLWLSRMPTLNTLTGLNLITCLSDLTIRNTELTSISSIIGSNLTEIEIISNTTLSTIDISNAPNLQSLTLENNLLTTLDISNNSQLSELDIRDNNFLSDEIDDIMDDLITFNMSGSYFDSSGQDIPAYPDEGKTESLDLIWNTVITDGNSGGGGGDVD